MRPIVVLALLATAGAASAQPRPMIQPASPASIRMASLPPGAAAREAQLLAHMGPRSRAFILREARREASIGRVDAPTAYAAASANYLMLGGAGQADIDALVFLIMAQVARDADNDLRQQTAAMRNADRQKAALRGQQQAMAADQAADRAALARQYASLKAAGKIAPSTSLDGFIASRQVDNLPPPQIPPPQTQIRLQDLTERRAKAIEMLSDVLKKNSDTASGITSNMK